MKKQVEEAEEELLGTDYFRSYYKDYTLAEVTGPDGIARNEFVYGGMLYKLSISRRMHIRLKLVHSVLFCIMLLCIVLSNLVPVAFNLSKVAAVPMFILILLMVLRFFSLIFYWSTPLEMREWDYKRGPKRLRRTSLLCAVATLLFFLVSFVLMLATKEFSAAAGGLLLLQIPGGLSGYAAYIIEKKLSYSAHLALAEQPCED